MTRATDPALILIVDDDPIVLTGIAAVLNASGYQCHCARDRKTALLVARGLSLDLIICDVNLAGESGLDLCRLMRQQPHLEDVPVMFMSSAQIPDIVRRSHEAGGAYYLRKPFDPEVLIELVGKALWMPHLVQTRLNIAHAPSQDVPAAPKMARVFDAIQGIQMPVA